MTKTNVALALDGVLHRAGMRDILRSRVFAGIDELVAHHHRVQERVQRKPELAKRAQAAQKEAKQAIDATPLIRASLHASKKKVAAAAVVIAAARARHVHVAPGTVPYFFDEGSHVFIEGAPAHPLVEPTLDVKCAALSALYDLKLHDQLEHNKAQPIIAASDFKGDDAVLRWHLYANLKLSWRERHPVGILVTDENAKRMLADVLPHLTGQAPADGKPKSRPATLPVPTRVPKRESNEAPRMTCAKWFKLTLRAFDRKVKSGLISARSTGARRCIVDLDDLQRLNPAALAEADPNHAPPPPSPVKAQKKR